MPTTISQEPSDLDNQRYKAFRPIIPSHIADPPTTPMPSPNITRNVETKTTTPEKSKTTSDAETQELKKQIAILEAELKKMKALPSPSPLPTAGLEKQLPKPNAAPQNPNKNEKQMPLPIFNINGITTTQDKNNAVRISVVDTLLFMSTSWKLTPDAEGLLRRIITEIQAAYPDAEIDIEGHTDNLDIDPKNPTQKHDIASIKAGAVMDYCVKTLKCNPTKIKIISCGSKHPTANNATQEGRTKNNRIEIVILPKS
ncbi:MAG: OmpA family protein [Planctomycetaceae bacterium]|nr:OmpA family protein [Planctomycetaceae bacterium]